MSVDKIAVGDRSWLEVAHMQTPHHKIEWEQRFVMGHPRPRQEALFGAGTDAYTRKNKLSCQTPTPEITAFVEFARNLWKGDYSSVLANKYNGKTSSIAPHADDEAEIDQSYPVVSLSVGGTRNFRIRDKKTKAILLDFPLQDGMVVAMCGEFQDELTHEITKVGKRAPEPKERVSFTTRVYYK
jgi:alkylated DNA repair dioxygenase AlkB